MKNIKNLLLILVGFILAIGISSAYTLNANEVTYDKKNTNLVSEDVQGAIDELGVLATTSMSEVKNQLNSIEAKIDNILEQNNTVIGGSYKELYNTFHQNDESSWNYTATSKVSLIVYVSCIHDGNNGSNSIVGKLNNSVITPSLTMIGTYYSSPITYVYTIDVNAGDTLYFSATPTVKTSNEEAQRSFTSVVVYYISE